MQISLKLEERQDEINLASPHLYREIIQFFETCKNWNKANNFNWKVSHAILDANDCLTYLENPEIFRGQK